jgi:hypothetical protein
VLPAGDAGLTLNVAQVFSEGEDRARFVWTADLLPNELAESTAEAMAQGTAIAKKTLEARAAR